MRQQFVPILGKLTNKVHLKRLYLDYNATSPLSQSVLDWLKSGDIIFANPSSQHSAGKASRKIINESRNLIFSTFKAPEKEHKLFFHSGATEGLHSVMHSFVEHTHKKKNKLLVCFSKIDHPVVVSFLEKFWGEHVEFFDLSIGSDLEYQHEKNLLALKEKKQSDKDLTILYHHLWVHNETGYVSPLSDLQAFKTIPDLYIHVDAVQAPGKIPEWFELCGGDAWTFSAHKFGALKGVGFTLMKKDLPFTALLLGGGQQFNLRSGTENVQGVLSLSLALKDLKKISVEKTAEKRLQFVDFFNKNFLDVATLLQSPNRKINSNTVYFYLHTLTSDVALALFDIQGLEISAGSACSSGAAKASAILLALNLKEVARNGLRLSFALDFTDEDLEQLKTQMLIILLKLKSV